ncbi:MAG TPA: PepSY domain-containing protein [Fredinandcohnia sp.]|nr:PepSY domain-containing protein [Fredinandcohnia sp.]
MKRTWMAVVLFLVASPAWAGEDVPLEQVPEAARRTIQEHVGDGTIEDVERDREKGRVVYEVEYRDPTGTEFELKVGEDGELIAKRYD